MTAARCDAVAPLFVSAFVTTVLVRGGRRLSIVVLESRPCKPQMCNRLKRVANSLVSIIRMRLVNGQLVHEAVINFVRCCRV